jgi:hypothetical protein
MSRKSQLQDRLAKLRQLVGGAVDCLLESQNNVERAEWDFATTNLQKLFRNAAAIARERRNVLADLRRARREQES